MKKYLIYPLISIFFIMLACNNEDEGVTSTITYEELPVNAQNFLQKYFRNYSYEKGDKIVVDNLIIYKVELESGYRIDFNGAGNWTQVTAGFGGTIPTGFIPEPILQTLDYSYHGYGINQINTEGENYHLVLTNNQGGDSIEIIFNQSGEILSTGNDNPV